MIQSPATIVAHIALAGPTSACARLRCSSAGKSKETRRAGLRAGLGVRRPPPGDRRPGLPPGERGGDANLPPGERGGE